MVASKNKICMQSLSGSLQKSSKKCVQNFVAIKKSVFAKKQKQAWLDINTKRFLCSINFVKKVQLCKEHVIWCNCAVRGAPINDYIETMRVVLRDPERKKCSREALKIISKMLRSRMQKDINIYKIFNAAKEPIRVKKQSLGENKCLRKNCCFSFQKNRQKSYEKFQKS